MNLLLTKMSLSLANYCSSIEEQYKDIIENKWVWLVVALVILVGIFAYAFYCTSKGYTFSGKVKLNWPKVWQMGIGCYT